MGPSVCERTVERMPSAPTIRSASSLRAIDGRTAEAQGDVAWEGRQQRLMQFTTLKAKRGADALEKALQID